MIKQYRLEFRLKENVHLQKERTNDENEIAIWDPEVTTVDK